MATQKEMLRFVKRQIKEHSGDGEEAAFWTMLERFWPEEAKKLQQIESQKAQRERDRRHKKLFDGLQKENLKDIFP